MPQLPQCGSWSRRGPSLMPRQPGMELPIERAHGARPASAPTCSGGIRPSAPASSSSLRLCAWGGRVVCPPRLARTASGAGRPGRFPAPAAPGAPGDRRYSRSTRLRPAQVRRRLRDRERPRQRQVLQHSSEAFASWPRGASRRGRSRYTPEELLKLPGHFGVAAHQARLPNLRSIVNPDATKSATTSHRRRSPAPRPPWSPRQHPPRYGCALMEPTRGQPPVT